MESRGAGTLMLYAQYLHNNTIQHNLYPYCVLRGRIKGFNSAIYAIKCQQVVIELWLGSYR